MIFRSLIYTLVLLIVMPFSVALWADTVGSNLGLDFYSRIDDAWDALAQGILTRRLTEKRTYGALGCGVSWLSSEPIDQITLEELRVGNYGRLGIVIAQKKVDINTDQLSRLSQCLVEQYNALDQAAHEDQNTIETVGNVGLYMDGDIANSDYDILTDITRINSIIFREKYPYTGAKNATTKSLASLLRWDPIAPLFAPVVSSTPLSQNLPLSQSGSTLSGGSLVTTSLSGTSWSTGSLPWATVCSASSASGGSDTRLFDDGFFSDIGSTIGGGSVSGWVGYIPAGSLASSISSGSTLENAFGLSEKADFAHSKACEGILCITIDMVAGSQAGLGGFSNTSIESLLEQHSKMMDPISWSDLSAQKMTNNSYQLPFLNIKIKNKIAGARVYTTESPQIKKQFKTEDTQAARDAVFDRAFRCAMNEAWLPGDPILANGSIWAWLLGPTNTTQVASRTTPLGPTEMDNLAGCYQISLGMGQKEAYQSLSSDLNEIQAFTQAMMRIILDILDTDRKLDTLPTK